MVKRLKHPNGSSDQTIQQENNRDRRHKHSKIYTNDQQMKFSNTFIQGSGYLLEAKSFAHSFVRQPNTKISIQIKTIFIKLSD